MIHFVVEFEKRYESYLGYEGEKKRYKVPSLLGKQIFKKIAQYNLGNMKSLESKTGKIKTKNRSKPKRIKVSALIEHD